MKRLDLSFILSWLLLLLLALLDPRPAAAVDQIPFGGKVRLVETAGTDLAQRLERGLAACSGQGPCFLAWGIESSDKDFHSGNEGGEVYAEGDDIHVSSRHGSGPENGSASPGNAILLLFEPQPGSQAPRGVAVIELDSNCRFEHQPLYWLGMLEAGRTGESLAYLEKLFQQEHLQKKLLLPIALHRLPEATRFLYEVAKSKAGESLRQDAVFWLGARRLPDGLPFLRKLLGEERGLRKKIVFSLSLLGSKEALSDLVALARSDTDLAVRREAIFWLGQKASEEAVRFLKETVGSDGDIEIRRHAVFAISQLPHDKAVPMLMDIAKNNPRSELRKQALFWLGQTGSVEALKLFEEILLGKGR